MIGRRRLVGLGATAGMLALATPRPGRTQGMLEDTAETLAAAPPAPGFRGALPARADLSARLPPPRAQGWTSTCVSWATTYYAASHAHRVRADAVRRDVTLSPAFTYALVGGDEHCRRDTRIAVTLEVLRSVGALPIEEFAYDAGWCGRRPDAGEMARAAAWRIRGWGVLEARDPVAVKGQIARGAPVIFGTMVGQALRAHRGAGTFDTDEEVPGTTGHAMLAVGYDDARAAFRIVNSWGRGWGDGGFAWLSYALWQRRVLRGFVIE